MAKEYLIFVDRIENLPIGKETELLIKDLTPGRTKYDSRWVKAVVSDSPAPGGDSLIVKGLVGLPYPGTRGIKITKEVGEFPSTPLKALKD